MVSASASRRSSSAPPIPPSTPGIRSLTPLFCHCLPALTCEGFALLHQSEAHLLPFQPLPHSFAKTPGCHQECAPNSSTITLTPSVSLLESTLANEHSVLAEISRSCPPVNRLESTLTDFAPVTPLSATLTKNAGRGCFISSTPLGSDCHPERSEGSAFSVRFGDYFATTGNSTFDGNCFDL